VSRDIDELAPDRFPIEHFDGRGFDQAFVRVGVGGVPLLLVHGWPETRRIFWRVIEPLASAGFDVIVPDLRGFGDSDLAPDGRYDVPAHAADLAALLAALGCRDVVLAGGDLGGPVIQELSLRHPDLVDRMVIFNSPLPYLKEYMASIDGTRPPVEAADYFIRQGTDADALVAELATPAQRRRYIATFYTSRFWAHPGAFDTAAVDFMTEPFADAARLRASFANYEAAFVAGPEPSLMGGRQNPTRCLILFGPSDHVIYPAFDRMAAAVFSDHVGPFLLRDCGHFVPWEAPHAFASATIAFCGDRLAQR
jgi:pimeloyl-ACP methyl ester carboxylesterase